MAPGSRKAYTIGDYRVEGRPLGKGGYAFVHHVVSKRGASYAMKELRHALRDQRDAVKRFHHEFEVTSALEHPNVVKMHECFEANGTWNIRMELVDGASLEAVARAGEAFRPDVAAALALPLLSALEFAHESGTVHRDVKPANVLVSRAGVPKLTDFGIARVEDAQVTREGLLLGTPSYMSPEQLSGRRGNEIDGRSDLYSLAVVLYELVTKRHPHGVKPKSDIYEVIRIKNEEQPKPLALAGAEPLEAVLHRALARAADERFANAAEMAEALRPIAASKRELKKALADRVAALPVRDAERSRGKRGGAVEGATPDALAVPWLRGYAPLAAASGALLAALAGVWMALHPGTLARLEDGLRAAFDRHVEPVVEKARHEAAGQR